MSFNKIDFSTIPALLFSEKYWMLKTIDMHTGGEPLRVIVGGFPPVKGDSVLSKRRYIMDHLDYVRKTIIYEPRGHADMYGCLIVDANDEEGDFGVIFMHNEGYSTMCGHAVIALAKLAVLLNWIDVQEGHNKIKIDAPCGRVNALIEIQNNEIRDIYFHGVPSFVLGLDLEIDVPQLGKVTYDLAYGGAFYAYVDLTKNNLSLELATNFYNDIVNAGMVIKRSIQAQGVSIEHPFESDLSFLYGTIFIDALSQNSDADNRNVCVFADGEVDRCPTGSGVSGRMAIHYQRKELMVGDEMKIESITGSVFKGSVVSTLKYGKYDAVIPRVSGNAFITGVHTFLIDQEDPLKEGFLLKI